MRRTVHHERGMWQASRRLIVDRKRNHSSYQSLSDSSIVIFGCGVTRAKKPGESHTLSPECKDDGRHAVNQQANTSHKRGWATSLKVLLLTSQQCCELGDEIHQVHNGYGASNNAKCDQNRLGAATPRASTSMKAENNPESNLV